MNYKMHYDRLIERARARTLPDGVYFERHHIVPKCMGGYNQRDNLVRLTPEEHFVAHQLLVKIHPENFYLIFACRAMMLKNAKTKRNNKMYGWITRRCAKNQSEKMKINNPMRDPLHKAVHIESMKPVWRRNTGKGNGKAKSVICIEEGMTFDTRSEAGAWLRSIGHTKAHGGSLSEALKFPDKCSSFGFHWRYA